MKKLSWLALLGMVALPVGNAVAADRLAVTEGTADYDADGYVKVTGEVRNLSSSWVCGVTVDVELLNAAGKPIGVKSVLTATREELGQGSADGVVAERYWLAPNSVATFSYLRDRSKLQGAGPRSHRSVATGRGCPGTPPQITVEGFKGRRGADGEYLATGTLKYTGGGTCRSPRVVFGFYRADGKLYYTVTETPDETFQAKLKPGQTVAFNAKVYDHPGRDQPADVKTWADCDHPE